MSIRAAGLLCALGLLVLLSSGCQSITGNAKPANADPLFGEKELPQPPGVAGPPPPPQNRAGMGAPSPPQAIASKSTAALLVPTDPLKDSRPIAIADSKQPLQTTGGWQPNGPPQGNLAGGSGGPGVILRTPEAGIQPVAPPINVPNVGAQAVPVVQGVSTVGFSDSDQLQSALKARGVLSQETKTLPDGSVRFTCRVANPQDPTFSRVVEATAGDSRSAILAVLDQIDVQR